MGEGDKHYTSGGGTDTKGVVPPFLRICASLLKLIALMHDNIFVAISALKVVIKFDLQYTIDIGLITASYITMACKSCLV